MLESLLVSVQPFNIMIALLGTVFGMVIGIIPGLGPTLGLALLIPITLPMDPISGLTLLGAAFGSAIYGGCISAILINAPGTPGNVATSFDGYPLAMQGRGAYAVGAATVGSGIGGIMGILSLTFLGPPIARFSLTFGPSEYFLLAATGLAFIARTIKGHFLRGLISALLGFMLSFIGQDIVTGFSRFSFGIEYFQDRVQFIPVIIGLFAISQALSLADEGGTISQTGKVNTKELLEGALEPFKNWKLTIRAGLIGVILGAMPGIGISTANLLAYSEAQRSAKDGETFGTGNIKGVIAPETANNAVEGGSLIPALTLGIPGGATAAVFLAALNLFGIQTGFRLYSANSDMLYALLFAMALGTIMFVIVGLSTVPALVRLTVIPNTLLVPGILVMCILGSYSIRFNFGDVWLSLAMGVLGYIFNKLHFPVVPMVIAMVLGPIAEQSYIRTMLISNWSYGIFIQRPISLVLIVLMLLVLFSPLFDLIKEKKRLKHD